MCPKIISIGPFTVYSYGLMLATGFLVGSYFLTEELRRRKLNRNVARSFYVVLRWLYIGLTALIVLASVLEFGADVFSTILQAAGRNPIVIVIVVGYIGLGTFIMNQASRRTLKSEIDLATAVVLISLVYGVFGTKILFLFENMEDVLRRPFDMLVSTTGLSFFGGPVLVIVVLYLLLRMEHIRFFSVADATAPSLLLGYGIGRLGCHFAGDGCYGFPTTLPWGTDYSKGVVPPSQALARFPAIAGQYPNGIPDTIPLHPTPVYEFIACALLFAVLWKFRKSIKIEGRIFMLYLVFAGIERFAVEFLRLNPRVMFGLSGFQIFAFLMVLAGVIGWYVLGRRAQGIGPEGSH
jgi:phosphatidylglycerol---prolipoprotein diacylglyceryl transferase